MKKKILFGKILAFLCFIFLTQNIYSQGYNKLLGNQNYWYITSCFGTVCQSDNYFAIEDTVINGLAYKFLDGFHYNKQLFIREDTVIKKVFVRPKVGVSANKDVLLYDFSLNIGDSMDVFNPNSPLPHFAGFYRLDSIIQKQIAVGNRNFFYLSQGQSKTVWVEGIGALSLINTPSQQSDIYGVGDLSCFFKDGVHIYESDTLPLGPCSAFTPTAIEDNSTQNNDIIDIYPNPAASKVVIKLTQEYQEKIDVTIINSNGQLMKRLKTSESIVSINTNKWKRGIYFIQIISKGEIRTNKIVLN